MPRRGSGDDGLLMEQLLEAEKDGLSVQNGEGRPGSSKRKDHPAEGRAPESPSTKDWAGGACQDSQAREELEVGLV